MTQSERRPDGGLKISKLTLMKKFMKQGLEITDWARIIRFFQRLILKWILREMPGVFF
jgi:hypothetical protein